MANASWKTGLIGGVERREIELVEHSADRPKQFERHRRNISCALGDAALRIEHIGSTAVPDLAAKPIVDILVVVADAADESSYLALLEAAGYVLRVREPDWHEHRMFRTPSRDVHVHIYSAGCPEIERNLTFRDRLRRNSEDRRRYEETKRKMAAKDWPDMNAYAAAKSDVIESIIAAARAAGEITK